MIWFDQKSQKPLSMHFIIQAIKAKPMAPMERARWELSIGAIFVYETWISPSPWLGFGNARNSDLKCKSNHDLIWSDLIWFEPDFSPHDLIWFDLTILKKRWFDLIWKHIVIASIWFDLNLPTPDWVRKFFSSNQLSIWQVDENEN